MLNKYLNGLALCASFLLITACAETPPPNFYTLEALNQPVGSSTTSAKKRLIGLGPL